VEEPEIIPGTSTYSVRIESDFMNDWWETFVRDIDIIIPECSPSCSISQIEQALGDPFTRANWTAVRVKNVYYVHSGWSLTYGPEFGEFLKRMHKAGDDFTIWFDNDAKVRKAGKIVDAEAETKLSDLFQTEPSDEYFVTCWFGYIGSLTPKLIIQIQTT
jgi:hypothetical protein